MENKLYFHNMKNQETVLLATLTNKATILMNGRTIISLQEDGYYIHGASLEYNIKIYYDSVNKHYKIIRQKENNIGKNISIELIGNHALGDLINEYCEVIDVSSYTKLDPINMVFNKSYVPPIKRVNQNVEAGTLFEYVSNNANYTYQAFSSIVMINARTSGGTSYHGLYYMYKTNENANSVVYTMEKIFGSENDVFNITPTSTGFTCQHGSAVKYKITEISTDINGL